MNCKKAREVIKTFDKISGVAMTDEQANAWNYVVSHKNNCDFCKETYEIAGQMEVDYVE